MIRCLLNFLGPQAHIKVPLFEQQNGPSVVHVLIQFDDHEQNETKATEVDDFEDYKDALDPIHWKFVIHHIDLFNKEGVIKFISSYLDTFCKIDISEVYKVPEKNVRPPFIFDVTEFKQKKISKLATVSSFVDKGIVVNNLPLLHNYFTFTYNKISFSLLMSYLNIFIAANDDEGVSILLDNALGNSISFDNIEQEDDQLFTNDVFYTDKTFILTHHHLARVYKLKKLFMI